MKLSWTWLVVSSLFGPALCGPQVQLGGTTLSGQDVTNIPNVEFFGGIPFAEPPLGALRFTPPVLKTTLTGSSFDATHVGVSCPQVPPVDGDSEDCLTINIYRPAGIPANASLPVMLWIYGGGWAGGTAASYDGSTLVNQSISRGTPVIFVSFNYRLGLLGFPQGNEATQKDALNLGLKDMIPAMQWVNSNIGAFGGDKTKVTLFGESAGAIAISILYLNQNPPLDTLVRAAIMESGGPNTEPLMKDTEHEANWEFFTSQIPQCSLLMQSPSPFGIAPLVDGPNGVYPDYPSSLYAQGKFAKIPFISGSNKDECTMFADTGVNSDAQIHDHIIRNFSLACYPPAVQNTVADRIMQLYPDNPALGSPFDTGNQTFGLNPQFKRHAAILGDIMFHAPRRAFTKALASHGVTAFGYHFTSPQVGLPPYWGVPHAVDIEYLYPMPNFLGIPVPTSLVTTQLGTDMRDYWISFATSLNPNDGHGNTNRIHWPQYHATDAAILELNTDHTIASTDSFRNAQIGYLISETAELEALGVPTC